MVGVIVSVFILLLQLFLGLLLAIFSVYLSLRFFDSMTEGIDEITELKRGNVAVAIMLLALIASVGMIIAAGVNQFESIFSVQLSLPMFAVAFVVAMLRVVVTVIIAVFAIFVAIRVIDTLTVGIDEMKEIKKGNVAVALVMAAVIYVVALVTANVVETIASLQVLTPEFLATIAGVR